MQPKSSKFSQGTVGRGRACPLAQRRERVVELWHDLGAESGTLDGGLSSAVSLDIEAGDRT
jgi:hypothetical protein